jgi:putative transposase
MKSLASLGETAREDALLRFRILRPHLEAGLPLRVVAEEGGIAFRTAQRWVARYREHGLVGLAREPRGDRGQPRGISQELRKLVEGLGLERPVLPARSVYRQAGQMAELRGESAPSYWTVCAVLRSLPPGLVTLAHEGPKKYSDRFDLVHRREAAGPNALWQVDHAQLNLPLARENGSAAKPWLTVVLDDWSRAVAGYYLAFEPPSTLRTSLALRQAIWRKEEPGWPVSGIPEALYTDNGSDFRSRHMEQVAADLKMRLIFSTPGKPRGRGRIERFFRTVEERFLCDQEGYLQRSRAKPTMSLQDLDLSFRQFLLDIYHRTLSAEASVPPVDRWQGEGFLPRMPDSLEQLDLLLIHEVRARRVRRDGIHFQGIRYLSPVLAAYVGEEVTVRYDPRDMGEIRVFYRDQFLCRTIAAELAGESVSLREIVRARNGHRRELTAQLRVRRDAVDALLALRRGEVQGHVLEDTHGQPPLSAPAAGPRLKRYWNE